MQFVLLFFCISPLWSFVKFIHNLSSVAFITKGIHKDLILEIYQIRHVWVNSAQCRMPKYKHGDGLCAQVYWQILKNKKSKKPRSKLKKRIPDWLCFFSFTWSNGSSSWYLFDNLYNDIHHKLFIFYSFFFYNLLGISFHVGVYFSCFLDNLVTLVNCVNWFLCQKSINCMNDLLTIMRQHCISYHHEATLYILPSWGNTELSVSLHQFRPPTSRQHCQCIDL